MASAGNFITRPEFANGDFREDLPNLLVYFYFAVTLFHRMQITKQLALFLENRVGMLARVCDALSAAKVNIYAISTSDTVDHIVIRMVVSEPDKAMAMFEERGSLVVQDDVLMITGDNKPGSLAKIAHKLADAKINIEYAYCATSPDAKKGLLIMRVADAKKAMKVLNS